MIRRVDRESSIKALSVTVGWARAREREREKEFPRSHSAKYQDHSQKNEKKSQLYQSTYVLDNLQDDFANQFRAGVIVAIRTFVEIHGNL